MSPSDSQESEQVRVIMSGRIRLDRVDPLPGRLWVRDDTLGDPLDALVLLEKPLPRLRDPLPRHQLRMRDEGQRQGPCPHVSDQRASWRRS